MVERRPLVAGLKTNGDGNPDRESMFVFGAKAESSTPPPSQTQSTTADAHVEKTPVSIGRVPLTTRVRTDFATALKRASLERQLNGQVPSTLQDILEEALGPWLRANGYVK